MLACSSILSRVKHLQNRLEYFRLSHLQSVRISDPKKHMATVYREVSATQLPLKILLPPMDKIPVGLSYTSASLLHLRALGKEIPLKCSQEQRLKGYVQF